MAAQGVQIIVQHQYPNLLLCYSLVLACSVSVGSVSSGGGRKAKAKFEKFREVQNGRVGLS